MIRKMIVVLVLVAGLFIAGVSQASSAMIETQQLIVSDATGKLSNDQLKSLADQAQTMLERILAFWSADLGRDRYDKIRVIFDVPRRDVYSSVFYWEKEDGRRVRIVRVFKSEGLPQMMAHKLTSAVFPQKDKLIRNMMGILTEAQIGNPLTFPMCGFSSDEWVLVLLETKSYIPLNELGPDHESWGMKDAGGGKLSISDKVKQHKAYAETGSFGNYLFKTYGINKIKRLQKLSQEKDRPWQEVFGISLHELEDNWLKHLRTSGEAKKENVSMVLKLFEKNPDTACAAAQKLVPMK
jgi:3-oxoacyl-ACP reductase-like protein